MLTYPTKWYHGVPLNEYYVLTSHNNVVMTYNIFEASNMIMQASKMVMKHPYAVCSMNTTLGIDDDGSVWAIGKSFHKAICNLTRIKSKNKRLICRSLLNDDFMSWRIIPITQHLLRLFVNEKSKAKHIDVAYVISNNMFADIVYTIQYAICNDCAAFIKDTEKFKSMGYPPGGCEFGFEQECHTYFGVCKPKQPCPKPRSREEVLELLGYINIST